MYKIIAISLLLALTTACQTTVIVAPHATVVAASGNTEDNSK